MYAGEGFTVEAKMPVEQWMEGGPGVIHGGILSSALDDVMGMTPRLLGPPGVTVHLQVDFLQPIPVGKTLHIRAEILGRQRRKIYTEGVAHLGDPGAAGGARERCVRDRRRPGALRPSTSRTVRRRRSIWAANRSSDEGSERRVHRVGVAQVNGVAEVGDPEDANASGVPRRWPRG